MPRLATMSSRLVTLLGSIALVALFTSQAAAGPSFVYALQQVTENVSQIHGFRLDLVSGALTPLPGFPVATGGKGGGGVKTEAMAYAVGRLYVINNESNTLSAFSVDQSTGALTALPFSPIVLGAGWWDCVAVHPSGSPVVAGNAEGGLSSFVITATTATAAAGSPFATGGALPFSCAFSRDGSFVYTGGTSGASNSLIAGFSVAAGTGVLTPLPGSPFDSGNSNPRGYATDKSGRLFAANFAMGQVSVFTTAAGVPTGATGNPFVSGLSLGSHGVLHPRGFYMVAGRGADRVGVYRINGTGSATTLTAVPGSPFLAGGTLTTSLAITLDGGLLMVANGLTRNLTVFQVNSATGGLTSLGVQPPNTLGTTGQVTGLAFVPPPALGDFNADGTADLLWRNKVNGQDVGWLLNGITVPSAAFLPTIADTNWQVKGVGDFDANGKADVIWRNKITGQNIAWLMDGLTVASSAFLPLIADTNWEITGVGDFNADGKADVIWRNKLTGENIAWLMNGMTVALSAVLSPADTNWEIKGVGDVDGNGKADVVWRNKATGEGVVWLMNGASVSISGFLPTVTDTNWEIKGVGDLDGAGKADIVMRNKATGMNVAWLMNGTTVASAHLLTTVDTSWEIKAVRDVDGDGHADVVWRNKVTGLNVAWLMNGVAIKGSGFLPAIFDLNWDIVPP